MPSAFSSILRDRQIRVPALTLVALAFTYASTMPYQSIIGINELGLSDRSYSGLIFFAALVNVATSLTLGIWSDKLSDRRPLVLALSVSGMLGFGMIYEFRTAGVFIFGMLVLIPISNSTYSILFASIRATTNRMDRGRAAAITSTVRALFSGSWALAPGLIGLYLINSQSMTPAYGIAALASLTCFCLYLFVAKPAPAGEASPSPNIGFFSSLGRIFSSHVLVRVCLMALLLGLQRLNSVVSPLIITNAAGGTVVDVGFMAGLVAFLEMPFMLMWGALQRRFRNVHVLALGALIYCLYLTLLSFASAPWQIYALVLINACGAAAILSVPITYLQDLIADRPGLGSSLVSVNTFIANGISASIFAAGTSFTGYSGTALLAAVVGLASVGLLLFLERDPRPARQPT
ncbi:MFS transporter [Rhizobium grahamii]|uniref:Transmembrane MFS efflux transporter n=1 Tax=Rhizobium grahamii CCGE 502 TaxID=990285 RepID=S3I328_9HYPH|nr:MFS transporter [Rhizobium grahamii]EPE99576.1 transmembrane MFS efflux transporter [Rhizobium grahamii CCGE 502]